MEYIIDPQIITPAFREAFSQLSSISLSMLGVNLNSLPFWLSVIGFPLAMFEVFTQHIATAINLLLHNTHNNTVKFLRSIFQFFIAISVLIIIGLVIIYNTENTLQMPNINQNQLTVFFKYSIVFLFIVASIIILSSLSYLTGQGNYVSGIGFILGSTALSLEAIQNYGFIAQVISGVVIISCFALWHYGRKYNKAMSKKAKPQEDLIDGIQRRRKQLRKL